ADAKPQLGALASAIGEVYRYTLESTSLPLVEVKALQDWTLEREFKKVPGVADVVSWGGGIKQYQITVDPARLRAYNLTLKQVFDAVAANNANAGGSYIRQGEDALMIRGIGLVQSTRDIENVVVAAQKGTPVRVRDIGTVGIGTAIRFGILGKDHDDDLVQGIVLMRKGENPGQVIDGVRKKIAEVQQLLPPGVELKPYYSRDRLVQTTVTTVMRNLVEGAVLVVLLLSLFLYNVRAALIVAGTSPLSLLFAFIFMDLRGIPANLLSLGAIDFGIIVDGAVIMTENIVRRLGGRRVTGAAVAAGGGGGAGGAGGEGRGGEGRGGGGRGGGGAAADVRGAHHHDRVPADPHVPADRGQAVPADGGDERGVRWRRAAAHADGHPRPDEPSLPAAAGRDGEPAAAVAAAPLRPGAGLVRA